MATHDDRLTEAIRQMATFSVVDDPMPAILQRIAALANDTVEPAAMVGLTMSVNGRLATPVFTDEDAPEIDSAQYATGVGPCLDAFRTGAVCVVPSTRLDTTWPPFSAACVEHGILSTLSIPVMAKAEKLGALNFYAQAERAFGEEEETLARAFALQAAVVISNAQAYWSARALGDQLTQALESRVVIEQAKGVLMASGLTSEAAFAALRNTSQRRNRKLRDIAAEVIAEAECRARGTKESGA
ncbi:MAG TPA: GAF and ANTAR domain-containing protein [Acidimicrobiales bacterium]|nr:GAF and ANTAR domain-containing protein [Acidimicrobiales bacterium]